MMADLHSTLVAKVTAHLELARAASEGPWFYDSYARVYSSPMVLPYDEWLETIDDDHNLERYGLCEPCGEWKQPPMVPSKGLGHGCRLFAEHYRLDPQVAAVPPVAGDTAADRHQADARHIAANDPEHVTRVCHADLERLEKHHPTGNGECCVVCCPGDHARNRAVHWPCPEVRAIAAVYGVEIDGG
jgi:hypothetical protein